MVNPLFNFKDKFFSWFIHQNRTQSCQITLSAQDNKLNQSNRNAVTRQGRQPGGSCVVCRMRSPPQQARLPLTHFFFSLSALLQVRQSTSAPRRLTSPAGSRSDGVESFHRETLTPRVSLVILHTADRIEV